MCKDKQLGAYLGKKLLHLPNSQKNEYVEQSTERTHTLIILQDDSFTETFLDTFLPAGLLIMTMTTNAHRQNRHFVLIAAEFGKDKNS